MHNNCNCTQCNGDYPEILEKEVGICEICGDIMYDYHENISVNGKDAHLDCLRDLETLDLLDFVDATYVYIGSED